MSDIKALSRFHFGILAASYFHFLKSSQLSARSFWRKNSILERAIEQKKRRTTMDAESKEKECTQGDVESSGKQLLDNIANAAFDFAEFAPLEWGKHLHDYFEIFARVEGMPMNPTQQAWLRLLKAHGQNDANDMQLALQDIVNIVAEGLQYGEDILENISRARTDLQINSQCGRSFLTLPSTM